MNALDLYASCEHLLGIEDATEALHDLYLSYLLDLEPKAVLDIGCGRGGFMKLLSSEGITAKGIDLSELMVASCKADGLDVTCESIKEVSGEFDVIVAIFDVLNFLDKETLEKFLDAVAEHLSENGHFIADINTLHGFANVADGTMVSEDAQNFLSVDATFKESTLTTEFTLFQKQQEGCYVKHQESIVQYFHKVGVFQKQKSLKLIEKQDFSLYDVKDKTLLVLQKR